MLPKLTVAICTWNRADLLSKTLTQLTALQYDGDWELVLVDNNSTDSTKQVASQFTDKLPLRYFMEPNQGLSNARNRAVEESANDWIVWTDDDVLVSSDWLTAYAEAIEQNPKSDFFGGPVAPWFQSEPAKWIQDAWDKLADAYAIRQLGDAPIQFTHTKLPFGANFCIRTTVQRSNLFDTELGRKGTALLGGEEVTMMRSILDDGSIGFWTPMARVEHFIPTSRLNLKYIREYYRAQGQFRYLNASPDPATPRLLGYPRYLVKQTIASGLSYWFLRITGRPAPRWVPKLVQTSIDRGMLRESRIRRNSLPT